tara:strand:- start:251 stop:394 length:144 start_codon:yes stop_codon:yes gene_type:complete
LIHQRETLEDVEYLVVMAVEVEQQLLALMQLLVDPMLEVVQEEQVLQ